MPSYSNVFSQPFIFYTAETPNSEFAVPTGYTAVIRQWSCSQDIGGWIFAVLIQLSEAAPAVHVVQVGQTGFVNYEAGECRFAVPGGGIISIALSEVGASPEIYVGGYLLRNTLS